MRHPQIQTRDLSHEAIKMLIDALMTRHYAERDCTDEIGKRHAAAALEQADKLQRFLDR